MNHQKGFANIAIIVLVIVVLAGVAGYFTLVKKSGPIAQQPTPTPTQVPPLSPTPTPTPKATEAPWVTFSDGSHISFQYPSDWKVGKFEHNPNDFNLQPIDHFTAESKSNNIFISVTGHCMNTQCLTVYSLDDMVREFGAKIISTAKAKNVTGYKVKFTDGKTGYLFIKGNDLVTISTDIYLTYMDKIIPSLTMLTAGTANVPTSEYPVWIKNIIAEVESYPAFDPRVSLTQYQYRNQIVYYLPVTRCCDFTSSLYNESGEFICAPDGGFTGGGDRKCSDFFTARQNAKVIWTDPR
ncbi:hypothetical protein EXS61_02085 [Candidatus Parcubacteria bacterium]|nr:hypothetical protein [Candidatus Parcubacteria bacterium]